MRQVRIGFTGSRHGMTEKQKAMLALLMHQLNAYEFHHGCCVGADLEAAQIACEMKLKIVEHPPTDSVLVAVTRPKADEVREPRAYLERNREIVRESEIVIGCPSTMHEKTRGGTWSTVRHARDQQKKPTFIILPDGSVKKGSYE